MIGRGWHCLSSAARLTFRAGIGSSAAAQRYLATSTHLWTTPTTAQRSTRTVPTAQRSTHTVPTAQRSTHNTVPTAQQPDQDHAHEDVSGHPGSGVTSAVAEARSLLVEFDDQTQAEYPYCWLRDNCQCPRCYDHKSYTRRLVLDDWDHHDHPTHVQVHGDAVVVQWASGHESRYQGLWLQRRAFTQPSRDVQSTRLALKKELWGPDLQLTRVEYEALVREEEVLLRWLVTLEREGVALVTNAPRQPGAALNIINKAGFVKPTHYGTHYPISSKAAANSLAYTDSRLGMHNDLPYYQYVPGIIFLHCITQFTGEGGENDLADGFHVAEYLRRHHPQEYQVLTDTNVYFWNKGSELVQGETTHFYKLLNIPLIVLDRDGQVVRVNNSQLRDSYLDVAPRQVEPWYQALRLFNRVMQEQAFRIKLNSGEMLVMDNTRLLHGRTAYNGVVGERYMDQTYLDWDEALSKRRVLQEKYGVSLV